MRIEAFRLTRFQFRRDRVIGDSQVQIAFAHYAALEIVCDDGRAGLGFLASLFHPLPALAEIERSFRAEAWPNLSGQAPASLVHRVARPRGGNVRRMSLPFEEAINQALWDLAAQQAELPLWRLLGGSEPRVRAYASGLYFHLSDDAYALMLAGAASALLALRDNEQWLQRY